MDGVLLTGSVPIPGAPEFIARLRKAKAPFMVLTNNSRYTPRDHESRLKAAGLDIHADQIFTSALATARFLNRQRPGGSAYVIGEAGLTTALHEIGYRFTEHDPDYVVLGETASYSFESLSIAVRLVSAGARFIATNPDVNGPSEFGKIPACGAVASMIAAATGVKAYFVGKPNPQMMRWALRQIGAHTEDAVMIGDRMDTDMVAGIESGLDTILVLSGVTHADMVDRFPYRPGRIAASVAEVTPE
jgi:NagD protein